MVVKLARLISSNPNCIAILVKVVLAVIIAMSTCDLPCISTDHEIDVHTSCQYFNAVMFKSADTFGLYVLVGGVTIPIWP